MSDYLAYVRHDRKVKGTTASGFKTHYMKARSDGTPVEGRTLCGQVSLVAWDDDSEDQTVTCGVCSRIDAKTWRPKEGNP